jgi:hypothetical protein
MSFWKTALIALGAAVVVNVAFARVPALSKAASGAK